MKTLNAVGLKIAVSVAGLVALTAFGEYGGSYNPSSTSQDISKVGGLLNPASKALSTGKSGDAKGISQNLKETVEKAQKAVEQNAKITKWRKDNEALREEDDKLKTLNSFPAIIRASLARTRETAVTNFRNMLATLQTPQSQMNAADLDTSNLKGRCKDGVDFNQFKGLADRVNNLVNDVLKGPATQLVGEKDKKAKEDKLANFSRLAKEFDKIADRDDDEKGNVSVLDQNLSPEAQLDGLKADNVRLKKQKKDHRKQLVKAFLGNGLDGGLVQDLTKVEENDQTLLQIQTNFADSVESHVKAACDSAIQNANQETRNCNEMADELGRSGPFSPATKLGKAFAKIREYYSGDPTAQNKENFYQFAIQDFAKKLRCENANSQIESVCGSNLITQLRTTLRQQTKDPLAVLTNATQGMQMVSSAFAQVPSQVKRLTNSCQRVAKSEESVDRFLKGIDQSIATDAQQGQQQQQAGGQGTPRLQGARTGGSRGAATHRAGQAGR